LGLQYPLKDDDFFTFSEQEQACYLNEPEKFKVENTSLGTVSVNVLKYNIKHIDGKEFAYIYKYKDKQGNSPQIQDIITRRKETIDIDLKFTNSEIIDYHSELRIIEAYKRSDILCFISLHEGFGLPVIEANASGTPVSASNIEPVNLIVGNAACLVNPKSTKDIKSNIIKIINNDKYRTKLILKGLKNVKKYHPSIIAKQYCKIYEMFL
jgi:glycosyltransferase involved in cell wall biosynthesis